MPNVDFDDANRKQTESYPKLKLDTKEKARIAVLETPLCEYVHTLRAPKIDRGKPVMEKKSRRDGSTYEDYVYDFIGNPICLGDFSVLEERGVDPSNCPACALARSSDAILPPKRRFAMHVLRYNTKPGSFDLQSPFSVKLEAWGFTDERFNKLLEIKKEWADSGGLLGHDILLGPCDDKVFQKFDINVSQKSEWKSSSDRKAMVKESLENNKAEDLSVFCGRKVIAKYMEEDLERVLARWRVVNGEEPVADPLSKTESLTDESMNKLLETDEPTVVETEKSSDSVALDLDDILAQLEQ